MNSSLIAEKVLLKCPLCSRPAHLWGGDTCDVCDSDNSGINDKDEPIGTDKPLRHSLFEPASKGFVVTGFRMERPLRSDPRIEALLRRRALRNLPV